MDFPPQLRYACFQDHNTCRSHAQHGIFFWHEMLGTMPTLVDGHSFRFTGNIVSNGSSHPPPIGSVASVIGSVFPDRSVGALHPIVVRFIGSMASEHRKRFWSPFWVRGPRCAVCTIPRDDHTRTPTKKNLTCQKTPNSHIVLPPLQSLPQRKKFRRTAPRAGHSLSQRPAPIVMDVDAASSSAPVTHLLSEGDFFPADIAAALKH